MCNLLTTHSIYKYYKVPNGWTLCLDCLAWYVFPLALPTQTCFVCYYSMCLDLFSISSCEYWLLSTLYKDLHETLVPGTANFCIMLAMSGCCLKVPFALCQCMNFILFAKIHFQRLATAFNLVGQQRMLVGQGINLTLIRTFSFSSFDKYVQLVWHSV